MSFEKRVRRKLDEMAENGGLEWLEKNLGGARPEEKDMTKQDDARFPEWEPDELTTKSTILYHMSYAHEKQAEAEGIEWWGFNIEYWKRKYSRQELLDIHRRYHGE